MGVIGPLELSILEPNSSIYHHQHALFRNTKSAQTVPAQLIFPNGTFTIGLPPTSQLTQEESAHSTDIPIDEGAENQPHEQTLNSTLLVHASVGENEDSAILLQKKTFVFVSICQFLLVLASGGLLKFVGEFRPGLSVFSFFVSILGIVAVTTDIIFLYSCCVLLYTLLILFWLALCLSGPLDLLVVLATLGVRYCVQELRFLQTSQAFVILPDLVQPQ